LAQRIRFGKELLGDVVVGLPAATSFAQKKSGFGLGKYTPGWRSGIGDEASVKWGIVFPLQ